MSNLWYNINIIKHNQNTMKKVILTLAIVTIIFSFGSNVNAQTCKTTEISINNECIKLNSSIEKTYNLNVDGKDMSITFKTDASNYDFYVNQSSHARTSNALKNGKYITTDDKVVYEVVSQIKKLAKLNNVSSMKIALALVEKIQYTLDSNGDYWQYSLETLILGTGDCEDKSFLTATLLKGLGYSSSIIEFSDHIAVAVDSVKGSANFDNNLTYVETTFKTIKIGVVPQEYKKAKYNVYKI